MLAGTSLPPEFDWLLARAQASRALLNDAFRNYRPDDSDGSPSLVRQPLPKSPLSGGATASVRDIR